MVTTELRYFFKNGLSNRSREFIETFDMLSCDARTDYYLPHHKATTCGIKWREENLEIKSLVQKVTYINYKLEVWEKHSLAGMNKPETTDWWRVTKKRWLFYFDRDLVVRPQPSDYKEPYCQVELSEVLVNSVTYHSFCIESGGADIQNQSGFLYRCLRQMEHSAPGLQRHLLEHTPSSYPSFLLGLTTRT